MQRLLRYFDRRQWAMIAASIVFIVIQVWLDLKLPDYMSAITTLVQTEGSAMADILTQGGYMLLCALGSGVASVIVGYFAAQVAAGLARRLRGEVFDKTLDFSLEEVDRFSTASLINRTINDVSGFPRSVWSKKAVDTITGYLKAQIVHSCDWSIPPGQMFNLKHGAPPFLSYQSF